MTCSRRTSLGACRNRAISPWLGCNLPWERTDPIKGIRLLLHSSIGVWPDKFDEMMAALTQVREAKTFRTSIDALVDLRFSSSTAQSVALPAVAAS